MKKKIFALFAAALAATCAVSLTACNSSDTIYVDTNAYFAPFEYYVDANTIDGVDVEIMRSEERRVGKEC